MATPRPKIPDLNRTPLKRVTGKDHWGDFTPNRFILPLPPAKQPVRARAERRAAQPNAPALDPEGTPTLPSKSTPPRE